VGKSEGFYIWSKRFFTMAGILREGKRIEADELSEQQLSALGDPIRVRILEKLSQEPSYPADLAKEFECSKQKMYYHFDKLEEAELIEVDRIENLSGGEASFYKPTARGYTLDLGGKGEEFPLPEQNENVSRFLRPLVKDGEMKGKIVVGSPDQHGPDQVRALDGHLASEIAFKLGNYSRKKSPSVSLDTEVIREDCYEDSMVILGGVLTNIIAKRFNESFPAYFPSEEFPYRELETPHNSYSEGDIGVIAKTSNPENREESIFLVAGIENKGTRAAVLAFSEIEEVVEGYEAGQFYAVIRGLDLNSDGEIDDYEVIESD
jgi:DNA-binding transcriptional ArsR family regulator